MLYGHDLSNKLLAVGEKDMETLPDLTQAARRRVESELTSSETPLWAGRPMLIPYLRAYALPLFLIGACLIAFGWCYEGYSTWHLELQNISTHWRGLPLLRQLVVVLGMACLAAPAGFWMRCRKTIYVVTDSRAIIIQPSWLSPVKSYGPKRLTQLKVRKGLRGSGSIIFDQEFVQDNPDEKHTSPGFYGLRDVSTAEAHLRKLERKGLDTVGREVFTMPGGS